MEARCDNRYAWCVHPCEEKLLRRIEALGSSSIDQYAGNPGSYPVTVGLIDDSDAPNASNFNPAPQGLADRTSYLTRRVGLAGIDWKGRVGITGLPNAPAGNTFGGCGAWDAAHAQWLLGFGDTSNNDAWVLANSGMDPSDITALAWPTIGSNAMYTAAGGIQTLPVAVGIDPDGVGFWGLAYTPSTPDVKVQFTAGASAAWGNKRTVALATFGACTVYGGYFIYTTTQGIISSTANHGGAWSDFNSGIGFSGLGKFANNGSIVVFATGTQVFTSPDGVTWTERGMATGPNHSAAGVDWDATRGLFVCFQQHFASPFDFEIWTSPDGITWTESSVGPAGLLCNDFSVFNGDWVATLDDVSSGGPSGQIASFDGGATWWLGRASMPSNHISSSPLIIGSKLVSSPQQLMTFNGLWVRFSHLSGLPAFHL